MAQIGLLWCPRRGSSKPRDGRGVAVTSVSRHRGIAGCGGIGRKLMRELRKKSKVLCSAARPAPIRCQYDPLSYALNFDADGLMGDVDAYHFAFSSRFASGASASSSSSSSSSSSTITTSSSTSFKCPAAAGACTRCHLAVSVASL